MAGLTSSMFRRATAIGLVAGAVVVYLAMVGLVEQFGEREVVTGLITLGYVMAMVVPVIAGYRAGSAPSTPGSDPVRPPAWLSLVAGALAGALAGLMLAALVLLASAVDLRGVFGRMGPRLVDLLTLDNEPVIGAGLILAAGTILGAAGSSLVIIPRPARRVIVFSVISVLLASMMEPFLRPMLNQLELRAIAGFLYQGGAITVPAALMTLVIAGVITAVADARGDAMRASYAAMPAGTRGGVRIGAYVAMAAFLVVLPLLSGTFFSQVLVFVGLFLLLALGLNIVVGYAGLLDLGYVAFYAVGAYVTALLTSPSSSLGLELSFWISLPVVMIVAATTGILIGAPVLRLRGDYLAIVTLGFGEIARLLSSRTRCSPGSAAPRVSRTSPTSRLRRRVHRRSGALLLDPRVLRARRLRGLPARRLPRRPSLERHAGG